MDIGQIIMEYLRILTVFIELLFLFSTCKWSKWIQIISLVNPHVESHLSIKSSRSNQTLIYKLSLNYGFGLDQRYFTLLDLHENCSFVVLNIIFLFIYRSVYFQIHKLITDKVILEYFFSILFRRVFLSSKLQNV